MINTNNTMYVTKRNGVLEELSIDKIYNRIRKLAHEEPKLDRVSAWTVTLGVVPSILDKISTLTIG